MPSTQISSKEVIPRPSDTPASGEILLPRLKLWEIDVCFKCPLVGMCLNISEQKQLLAKAGLSGKDKNEFEIHETLIAHLGSENRLSKRMDTLFKRKFHSREIQALTRDPAHFEAGFKKAFDQGNYLNFLWIAAVTPDLPVETRRMIYGKVHMSMHENGERDIRRKRALSREQKHSDELRQQIRDFALRTRSLEDECRRLREENSRLNASVIAMEKKANTVKAVLEEQGKPDASENLQLERNALLEERRLLMDRLNEKERLCTRLGKENNNLGLEIERLKEVNRLFAKEAGKTMKKVGATAQCNENCPSYDLCRKRILMVGGMTKLESFYREIIERRGGTFEYHDGYMKNGTRALETRLKRADLILCPVNCNSHNACSLVKNLAKKYNKTVHMLSSSSLSAVSQIIENQDSCRAQAI